MKKDTLIGGSIKTDDYFSIAQNYISNFIRLFLWFFFCIVTKDFIYGLMVYSRFAKISVRLHWNGVDKVKVFALSLRWSPLDLAFNFKETHKVDFQGPNTLHIHLLNLKQIESFWSNLEYVFNLDRPFLLITHISY